MKKLCIYMILLICSAATAHAQWVQTTMPVANTINCISVLDVDIFAGTSGAGIYVSSDQGGTWDTVNTGITNQNIRAITADHSGCLYAGSASLNLFKSCDTGLNWTAVYVGGTGNAITSLAVVDTLLFLGEQYDGIFKSVNSGASWMEVGLCCASVLSLLSDTNGYVFAGTNTSLYRAGSPYSSWTPMNSGMGAVSVRALAKSGSNLFAGTFGNGIFISTDNGANWTAVNNGLTDLHVLSLSTDGAKILAGTDAGGVFLSVDNGQGWMQVNEGLTSLYISSLKIVGSNVFAGTSTAGIWKRPLSELTSISENISGSGIVLYPNPAQDIITISGIEEQNDEIAVKIYDLPGKLYMDVILNRGQDHLNISELSSGVYVAKISSGSFNTSCKLVIQR